MASPSPADPLGSDFLVTDDLEPSGRSATGLELVLAAVRHRLMCAKLPLIGSPNDEVDFGVFAPGWVQEATTDQSASAKAPLISIAVQRDERVARCDVTCSLAKTGPRLRDGSRVAIMANIKITTVTGVVLSRVLGISGISVDFLAQGT